MKNIKDKIRAELELEREKLKKFVRQALQDIIDEVEKEAYKKGYNTCLKEMKIKNEMGEKSL